MRAGSLLLQQNSQRAGWLTKEATRADNERRLARKCAELSSQAVEAAAKVQTAQVMSADDTKTIANLKEEVERAWAALEASHQKASAVSCLSCKADCARLTRA